MIRHPYILGTCTTKTMCFAFCHIDPARPSTVAHNDEDGTKDWREA